MLGFGIDIGGSGIKGAVVDLDAGALATERYKVLTPQPSIPGAVALSVADVVNHFGWQGPLGCTFPAVVQHGVARTAANVDQSWIGTNIEAVVGEATGLPVTAVNDADAAGIAETLWGAAKGTEGLVVVVTLGTGVGTALFWQGKLTPHLELAHHPLGKKGGSYNDVLGDEARQKVGNKKMNSHLADTLVVLRNLVFFDHLYIGGGNSRRVTLQLPPDISLADNTAGILGGIKLWERS